MDAHRRVPRPSGRQPDGQHLLRSTTLATELVDQAKISPLDLVLEIGAGSGRLTVPLAERAARVIAVERDGIWVEHLHMALGARTNVRIVHGDALRVPLPREPFRAFGNLPFAFGTRILRRLLDDPSSALHRLDALVQYEVARKRTAVAPSTMASLTWLPWWEFHLVRRISRWAFEPVPSVDAGMMSVTRRDPPLLQGSERQRFVRFVATGFAAPNRPVGVTFRRTTSWSRFARERGISPHARPSELDVFDWVALFGRSGRRLA